MRVCVSVLEELREESREEKGISREKFRPRRRRRNFHLTPPLPSPSLLKIEPPFNRRISTFSISDASIVPKKRLCTLRFQL